MKNQKLSSFLVATISIFFSFVMLRGILPAFAFGSIYFVDQTANGTNDGSGWDDAFTSLQSALNAAEEGDQIWVAAGVYKPTQRTEPAEARTETFMLIEGVAIYGGFDGSEGSLSERDWETNRTILSGDIDNNDSTANGIVMTHSNISGNNAYHVVTGDRTITYTVATVLDGFVVTGGLTEDASNTDHSEGGGITFQSHASPTLRNLWVIGNESPRDDGGGIHFLNNNGPILENITVENNRAGDHGGGIFFENDNSPTLKNISVIKNEGSKTTGLYLHEGNNATIANFLACGNFNKDDTVSKTGAGLSFESNNVIVVSNGSFTANVNAENGGALRMNANNNVSLYQVSMGGNQATNGGAIYLRGSGNTLNIFNSVLWGNSSEITNSGSNTIAVITSVVGDGAAPYAGTNNIVSQTDPFVESPSNGNDGTWGTADDDCGDLRLVQSASGVNAGSNGNLPSDILDLDSDTNVAEALPLDLDRENRIYNSTVDLGAYEISTDPETQTITFELPPDVADGMVKGESDTLTATASSGLPVEFVSSTPGICSISNGLATMLEGGICKIVARQLGSGIYLAAPEVGRNIQVSTPSKTDQTISFTSPADGSNATVGDGVTLNGTASSGLSVTFESNTLSVCQISGNQAMMAGEGTCEIVASQIGDETYNPAPLVVNRVNVSKAVQTINFPTLASPVPADAVINLSATASSGLNVSYLSDTPTVCSVGNAKAMMLIAGTCTVRAQQAGNATYAAAADVVQSMTVTKVNQTITFSSPQNGSSGMVHETIELMATADSNLPVSFSTTTSGICSVSGSEALMVAQGSCQIVAKQAGNGRYNPAPDVTHTISVLSSNKTAQSISFTSPAENAVLAVEVVVDLEAEATSNLYVSFATETPAICSVFGKLLVTNSPGRCEIRASQAGNIVYAAAPEIIRTVFVKANQTINFPTPPTANGSNVGEKIILSASASSELPVLFTSLTPTVCTVEGSEVTLVSEGVCQIEAAQAGDEGWYPAESVSISFIVGGTQIYLPIVRR